MSAPRHPEHEHVKPTERRKLGREFTPAPEPASVTWLDRLKCRLIGHVPPALPYKDWWPPGPAQPCQRCGVMAEFEVPRAALL